MKKQITIAQAAINYLHSIIDSAPVTNVADARKQNAIFRCMQEPLATWKKQVEGIQKKHRDEKIDKDPYGNDVRRFIIPEQNQEAYESDMIAAAETEVAISFDTESFSRLKTIFEKFFERPENEAGVKGESQMKFIAEIDRALAEVVEA